MLRSLACQRTQIQGIQRSGHTIADDFVARLALYVARASVSSRGICTGDRASVTMQSPLHRHPSPSRDRTILCLFLSAQALQGEVEEVDLLLHGQSARP